MQQEGTNTIQGKDSPHVEKSWYDHKAVPAVPADSRTWSKEGEKIEKYTELAWELRRIWKVQSRVVPVVIGALGTITTRHKDFLADLTTQKASFLGTAHILREVLS